LLAEPYGVLFKAYDKFICFLDLCILILILFRVSALFYPFDVSPGSIPFHVGITM